MGIFSKSRDMWRGAVAGWGGETDDATDLGKAPSQMSSAEREAERKHRMTDYYPALDSCIQLLSGECARLIANSLYVVNRRGERVPQFIGGKPTQAQNQLQKLTESPDGGATDGVSFWVDAFGELFTNGNMVLVPTGSKMLEISGLWLMRNPTYDRGLREFRGHKADAPHDDYRSVRREYAIHAKFAHSRNGEVMGYSPVDRLEDAIRIGKDAELWILGNLEDAGGRHSVIWTGDEGGELTDKQRREAKRAVGISKSTVLPGRGGVDTIDDKATDAEIGKVREFQLREIGRTYHVPVPLLGEPISAWGSGVEALSRELWKRAISPQVDRVLSALSNRLLPDGMKFQVNPVSLLRGDANSIATLLNAMNSNTGTPSAFLQQEQRDTMGSPNLTAEEQEQLDKENEARMNAAAASRVEQREEDDQESEEEETSSEILDNTE